MESNHNYEQNNKPSLMVPGITNQVMVSNANPTTQSPQALKVPRSDTSLYPYSSSPPSVVIDPHEPPLDDEKQEEEPNQQSEEVLDDEEQEKEPNQQSEEVDELGLVRIILLLDEEPEKQYHNFDNEDPPPGYKFSPTDFELIISYLVKKRLNKPLPWNSIVDVELYKHSPEWLAEEYKRYDEQEEWYFFTPRYRKYPNGTRPDRAAGDGYWKATGADKEIIEPKKGITVGYKKTLVYYKGKAPSGDKTNWIMYEYKINHPPLTRSSENDMMLDKWVLCKIYQKNESKSSKANTTRKACSKSSRANDRDEPMTNVDPTPTKFQRHINQSFHQNGHAPALAHTHALANQIQAVASNYGTLHHAHMAARRFPFDQSRAMAGNYGTPPPHMPSMLPNQSQAMTRRFSNQSQVMAFNHGTAPHSPMANMFPNQSRVMTGNHGTPPPAHMASRFPNQPRAMAFNHGASNFHNHFQPMAVKHETPQAFDPFYSRNPLMHSSKPSAIVGNSETSIQKGDGFSSCMPSFWHSNFSTTDSSGYMPSTSAFTTTFDTSNPRGYNNYQMDDEIPNKHQMPSDDHNPCK